MSLLAASKRLSLCEGLNYQNKGFFTCLWELRASTDCDGNKIGDHALELLVDSDTSPNRVGFPTATIA
jgi:hypothetical protein